LALMGLARFAAGRATIVPCCRRFAGEGVRPRICAIRKKDAEQTASWVGAKPVLDKILSLW